MVIMSDKTAEKRINLRVEIRRNSDGATKTDVWKDWLWSEYWWSEGNAACDCNREAWFVGSGDHESSCGHGAYSVKLADDVTGEVLYNEIDP